MDRWKAEQGRGREKRKIRRKKMQMREKVGKSRNTVFFQWFVAPEGWKSRPAKVVGAEAAWPDEKWKIALQSTTMLRDHFWKFAMSKKCTPLWREAHVRSQNAQNTTAFGPLLEVEMSKKCTPLWQRSTFWSQNVQNTTRFGPLLEGWDVKKAFAVVARQQHFDSQNVQNATLHTKCSSHYIWTTFGLQYAPLH